MKKLKTFKYLALSVFMTIFMVFNHENIRAQQSSNFRIALYDIGAAGVSPSQSVSSSSFSLTEGMVEKINCTPQQSSLYRFLPGMIFPVQEELTYCETNLYLSGCVQGDGLKNFVLGEIENLNSGCSPNGFGDFTNLVAIIQTSLNYTMYVTGGYSTQFLSVWIDLNDNYSFEEAERIVTDYSMPNAFVQYSIPLNLPAGSNDGLHRLRARVRYNSPCLDPCATYTYGEVEDYSVYVVNNPAFGTITGTITNNLTGFAVVGATVTDDSGLNSTISGPDGNYVLNNLPAGYRTLNVTKAGYLPYSGEEVFVLPNATATCNIALTPVLEYCTSNLYSVGCQSGDNINNFILGTLQNLNTGCSPGGYGDYTAMSTNLVSGNSYPVQIASQYGQQHVCIWIDWNDNYYFDENEKILNDAVIVNANQNFTFNLTIPINASSGTHQLRVRCAWATNPSDPCSSYNYGEAEDYTVTLSGGVETGIIAGTITNFSTGLPVSGAQITDATGVYSVLSGAEGVYQFNDLPVGSYILNVSEPGYDDYTSPSISVMANQTTVFNIALNPVLAYCTSNLYSIGCQYGDYIDNFVLADIHNLLSGCSSQGFGDFTNLSTTLLIGNTYPLQITNHVGSQYVCVWIDLDNSFSFDNNERLISNATMPGSSQNYTFDLAVPVSASPGEYRLRVRTAWNVNPADPCALYQYGETEDYTVFLMSGVQAATINGTITSAGTGLPIQGATVADASGFYSATTGIDGHYELSEMPAGIYTLNISKLSYQPFTSDPISLSAGQTITANFVLAPSQGYCVSNLYSAGCSGGDNINNFILGDIQHSGSGCSLGGYGDFTAMTTSLEIGNTYEVQITSQYWQQHICLWIDWNDSYYFDPNERLLTNQWMQLPNVPYTFQITIPASATPGIHRLRVRTVWNTDYFDPCATYQYGEVEDYTVFLAEGVQTGNIAGTITDSQNGSPVANALVEDAAGVYSTLTTPHGQYQLSNLPAGNYILNVTKTGFAPFTSNQIMVIAGETTIQDVILAPVPAYCTTNLYTVGCSYGDFIDDFTLENIQNLNSGCSNGNYGDFTDLSTEVLAGNSYTMQVSAGYNGHSLNIWIDLNDDFYFDEPENILSNYYLADMGVTYSPQITIPADANDGSHRMRVRSSYGAPGNSPCETYTYGEVEDYTVIISKPELLTHEIPIQEGWSGISTYLLPEIPEIESIFQGIINNVVILQNFDGFYWPGQNINTLGVWNNYSGYQIKASSDVILPIQGNFINPAGFLVSEGWNLIPVLTDCPVPTEEFFAAYSDDFKVLKEVAGPGVYWPEYGVNTSPFMYPGKSYLIFALNDFTMQFSPCNNKQIVKPPVVTNAPAPWAIVKPTPFTHIICLQKNVF